MMMMIMMINNDDDNVVDDVSADTGESMMIRGCAVDSGTLTTDTEIIRMSHCGAFYFDKRSQGIK